MWFSIARLGLLLISCGQAPASQSSDALVVSSPGLAVQDHINLVKEIRPDESYPQFHARAVVPWLKSPTFLRIQGKDREILIDSRLSEVKKFYNRRILMAELAKKGFNQLVEFSSLSVEAQSAFLNSEGLSKESSSGARLFLTIGAQVLIPSRSSAAITIPNTLPTEFHKLGEECKARPFSLLTEPAIEDGAIHLSVSKFASDNGRCSAKEAVYALGEYDRFIEVQKGLSAVFFDQSFGQAKSILPPEIANAIESQVFKLSDFDKKYFKLDDEFSWKARAKSLGIADPEELKTLLNDKSKTRIEWTISIHYGLKTQREVVKMSRLISPSNTFGLPKQATD